jgi:hypothetical protein
LAYKEGVYGAVRWLKKNNLFADNRKG